MSVKEHNVTYITRQIKEAKEVVVYWRNRLKLAKEFHAKKCQTT